MIGLRVAAAASAFEPRNRLHLGGQLQPDAPQRSAALLGLVNSFPFE